MRWKQSKPTGSKRRILWRIVGLFGPYRWHVAFLTVLIAIVAAMELVPALLIGKIVGIATEGGSTRDINLVFLALVAILVTAQGLGMLLSYINQYVGQGLMHGMRRTLHAHLQQMSVRFYTQNRTGEILSRVTTDVNGVQQAVTETFTEFLRNSITLTVAFGLMFYLEWQLAAIALVVLPLWVYPTVRVGMIMRRLRREWHDENARMASHLEETLSVSGAMLVKTFGRQDHEEERFRESSQTLRSLSIRRMMAGRWFNAGTALIGGLAPAFIYWYGGRAVVGDSLGIDTVVSFAIITTSVFQPFANVTRINTTMLSSLALFERIFEYLDLPVEIEESEDAKAPSGFAGRVRFEDVTFAYAEGLSPALDHISLEVQPGQMAALVGPSGAGKTTTTYLVQRFYDPQEGRITVDGHDLRDLTLKSVADAVGAVMQETYLFHTSLEENIRYGKLDATREQVEAAAAAGGLNDLIARLPEGLDTVVGERGYRLSGGEQQRVSIARAILCDPPVLILDEATASLDTRLEREIRRSMKKLAQGRTTLVIAHRLSTVVAADVIFVFDGGQIVERGKHEELLRADGLYASLYREQFLGDETLDPAIAGS